MFTIERNGKPLKIWFEHKTSKEVIDESKMMTIRRYGVWVEVKALLFAKYLLRSCVCHIVDATNDQPGVALKSLPEIAKGIAICNPRDNYVKEVGRVKALRRAIKSFSSAEQRLFVARYEDSKEESRRKGVNRGNTV